MNKIVHYSQLYEMLMFKHSVYVELIQGWFIGKDPAAGKDGRQEEKGTTEYEMVGWHHWLNGHEFEQALGVSDGQGSLACCSSLVCKQLDMAGWLKWI